MAYIIPKSKTKGIDFCGGKNYYYIIRSDLGCYMQSTDLRQGLDLTIFSLHPSCQNGDHYLADGSGYFYIIKGNSYRRVSNLTTDDDAVVYDLHPNCQGGDHYLKAFNNFHIIFTAKGTYRRTTNLTLDSDAIEYTLHPDCRNGLYYWGLQNHYCFLKPVLQWGVEYYKGTNINKGFCTGTYSFHSAVLNFLPGGLAVTRGPAFGSWEKIKTITNDSDTPVKWTKKINKKVGFEKEKTSQNEHNWKIDMSASVESGELSSLIAKAQFSVSAEYGGLHVSTEKETWSEVTEEEEQLEMEVKPKESIHVWQCRLGLGQKSVLFCREVIISNQPNPPDKIPLPPVIL